MAVAVGLNAAVFEVPNVVSGDVVLFDYLLDCSYVRSKRHLIYGPVPVGLLRICAGELDDLAMASAKGDEPRAAQFVRRNILDVEDVALGWRRAVQENAQTLDKVLFCDRHCSIGLVDKHVKELLLIGLV